MDNALVFVILLMTVLLCVNFSSKDCISSSNKETKTATVKESFVPRHDDEIMNDSTNATVMGMATGYDIKVFKQFVGSLRNSGYKGHIILVISNKTTPETIDYLSSKGVDIKMLERVPCTTKIFKEGQKIKKSRYELVTCAHPYPYLKIRWGRFPLLRDHLQACKTCTGPVLVTDVRDVLFQKDPFGDGAPVVKGLQVFQESRYQRTTHDLVKGPVEKCKDGLVIDDIMLCSGTTIGTREAMLDYLGVMHDEMAEWVKDPNCCCNRMNGDDQSIHNYLYYTGRFHNAMSIPNRYGIVHTVGVQASEIHKLSLPAIEDNQTAWLEPVFDLVDNEGFFINYDGGRSRVVHQLDRFQNKIKPWLQTNGLVDP